MKKRHSITKIISLSLILLAALAVVILTACSSPDPVPGSPMDGEGSIMSYKQISQEEAMQMMEKDDGHIIVDVRRQDEYAAGHIPGAVCIPNESIGTEKPEELPDLNQVILVYCRSGRRSKQASEKLIHIGYSNVYEFGGINTWTGEIVTGEPDAGSGQQAQTEGDRAEETQEEETQEEETQAEEFLTEKAQAEGSLAEKAQEEENQPEELQEKEQQAMKLRIGETEVPVTWEENESVYALAALAAAKPLTIQMSMYGGFEQVGPIGQSIVRNDSQTTTNAGDIVLYSGDQIVVFYGSNSWAYTRLGHVELSQEEMENLLGNGDVTLTLTGEQ